MGKAGLKLFKLQELVLLSSMLRKEQCSVLGAKLCLHRTIREAERKENSFLLPCACRGLSHTISDHPDYAETLQNPILDTFLQSDGRRKVISPQKPGEV